MRYDQTDASEENSVVVGRFYIDKDNRGVVGVVKTPKENQMTNYSYQIFNDRSLVHLRILGIEGNQAC